MDGSLRRSLALSVLATVACRDSEGHESGFSSSISTAPGGTSSSGDAPDDSSTSTGASEDSAAASSGAGTSSTEPQGIPDVGTPPDGGAGPPPGCKGKIDLIFTIDSSSTMWDQQQQIHSSFPGFIATLEQDFADFDYHILSANTAGTWGLPECEDCQEVCDEFPEFPCSAVPEACDSIRGAGVTLPVGEHASNKRCDLTSGRRYITAGQPDLVDAFTCIASLGIDGAEGVAETSVLALNDELNAEGGCHAGFLRDDALLVVVAIQDTFDQTSLGSAQDWANALIDAKRGNGDAVVLLVISNDIDDPDSLCGFTGTITEHKLRTWTKLMPHGLFRSMCVDDYASYFAEAAARIKTQCDVFAPQ